MIQNKTWAFHCIVCCANGLLYPMAMLQGASAEGILNNAKLGFIFFLPFGRVGKIDISLLQAFKCFVKISKI